MLLLHGWRERKRGRRKRLDGRLSLQPKLDFFGRGEERRDCPAAATKEFFLVVASPPPSISCCCWHCGVAGWKGASLLTPDGTAEESLELLLLAGYEFPWMPEEEEGGREKGEEKTLQAALVEADTAFLLSAPR